MSVPEEVAVADLVIRRLLEDDAPALQAAVLESLEHLRPWMPWVAFEPLSIDERRELLARWGREWQEGTQYGFGVFLGEQLAGVFGLHRRIGPGGLELGYWIHRRHTGRGYATQAAAALTSVAFGLPDTTHVEIHHDKANLASGRIPEKLGFRLVREESDGIEAPGETGVSCTWRIERDAWRPDAGARILAPR